MVSRHTAKFVGRRHYGKGDIFWVVGGQDSIFSHFNLPLLFISKAHCMPCSHTQFQDVDTIICECVQ